MGLNDVMQRLKEQQASQPTPAATQDQGMLFSRFERDRITEALRIAVRSRVAELRTAKRYNAKATQIATLSKQITDYNQLIVRFRNETARTTSNGIR